MHYLFFNVPIKLGKLMGTAQQAYLVRTLEISTTGVWYSRDSSTVILLIFPFSHLEFTLHLSEDDSDPARVRVAVSEGRGYVV